MQICHASDTACMNVGPHTEWQYISHSFQDRFKAERCQNSHGLFCGLLRAPLAETKARPGFANRSAAEVRRQLRISKEAHPQLKSENLLQPSPALAADLVGKISAHSTNSSLHLRLSSEFINSSETISRGCSAFRGIRRSKTSSLLEGYSATGVRNVTELSSRKWWEGEKPGGAVCGQKNLQSFIKWELVETYVQ